MCPSSYHRLFFTPFPEKSLFAVFVPMTFVVFRYGATSNYVVLVNPSWWEVHSYWSRLFGITLASLHYSPHRQVRLPEFLTAVDDGNQNLPLLIQWLRSIDAKCILCRQHSVCRFGWNTYVCKRKWVLSRHRIVSQGWVKLPASRLGLT